MFINKILFFELYYLKLKKKYYKSIFLLNIKFMNNLNTKENVYANYNFKIRNDPYISFDCDNNDYINKEEYLRINNQFIEDFIKKIEDLDEKIKNNYLSQNDLKKIKNDIIVEFMKTLSYNKKKYKEEKEKNIKLKQKMIDIFEQNKNY